MLSRVLRGMRVETRIPIFPLHTLLLPTIDLGIHVFEERYRDLIAHALGHGHTFGVVLIKHGREVGGPADATRSRHARSDQRVRAAAGRPVPPRGRGDATLPHS